jgi:peptidoglycan/LPS O-acetylase OafA/YrhL
VGVLINGIILTAGSHGLGWLLMNIFMLSGSDLGPESAVVPGGWSISAECYFALMFAALMPFVWSLKKVVCICLGLIAPLLVNGPAMRELAVSSLGVSSEDSRSEYFVVEYLPTFWAGVFVCLLKRRLIDGAGLILRWIVGGAGLVVLGGLAFGGSVALPRTLTAGLASAALVWAVATQGAKARSGRVFVGIGRVSYGIY